jgi:glycerophosphoryl diester phosphodiesterase
MKRHSRLLLTLTVTAALGAASPTFAADRPSSPVLVIGHRGASGLAPEHTYASYDLARRQGADYLEQDAQMTADGVLVSLHDATLDRTARGDAANCTGPVSSKTLAQLLTCDMGSWFNEAHPDLARPEYVGQRIPVLSDVFARYRRGVSFHVEVKDTSPATDRELLRLLDEHGLTQPARDDWRVLIQSFSPTDLALVHALDPALPTVQLLAGLPPAGPAQDAALSAVATYAVGIGPSSDLVDEALVEAAHAVCLQVQPYTVDDPQELRSLVTAGVDGVFTNRPDVLNDVLQQEGLSRGGSKPFRDASAAAERNRTCRR